MTNQTIRPQLTEQLKKRSWRVCRAYMSRGVDRNTAIETTLTAVFVGSLARLRGQGKSYLEKYL